VDPAAYSRCLVHFARAASVQEERERQTTAKVRRPGGSLGTIRVVQI
jgi:hypothetical protein